MEDMSGNVHKVGFPKRLDQIRPHDNREHFLIPDSYEKKIKIEIRYSQTLFTIVHALASSHLQKNMVAKHIGALLQSGGPFILNILPFSPLLPLSQESMSHFKNCSLI